MHLAMAKRILDIKGIKDNEYIMPFLVGNIIPDVRRGSAKKKTHFWTDEMFKRFDRRPDLEVFKEKYNSRLSEPYVFGYFCHLYMDTMYMERYWDKYFSFYDENMIPDNGFDNVKKIKIVNDDRVYDRETFFSDSYYYGDYDRMNDYFISKYKIVLPQVEETIIEAIEDIEEICILEEKEKLFSMVDRIKALKSRRKMVECNSSDFVANTKILDIKEIDELIKSVSEELSFY